MSVQRKQPIVVEVLYFDGCPSHLPTVDLVQRVSDELGVSAQIKQVELTSHDDPEQFRFLGSPTVRVNGVDVEPSARHRENFGFSCRVYGDGPGAPPKQMVADAIRRAAGGDTVADSSDGRNAENLKRCDVPGVIAVEVDLHGGKAIVGTNARRPVPEENILAALREAGYRGMISK